MHDLGGFDKKTVNFLLGFNSSNRTMKIEQKVLEDLTRTDDY